MSDQFTASPPLPSPRPASIRGIRWFQALLLVILTPMLASLPVVVFVEGRQEWAQGAAFSGDGRIFARSTDGGLGVFDLQTGRSQFFSDIGTVALPHDGSVVACGTWQSVNLWDWRNDQRLHSWDGKNRWSFHVAMSSDGTRLAAGDDSTLRLWNLTTGELIESVAMPGELEAIEFSPDGKFLVESGSSPDRPEKRNHSICIRDASNLRMERVLEGPEFCFVRALAISPDGKLLATSLSINAVRIWDLESGKELRLFANVSTDQALAFAGNGRSIGVGSHGQLTLLDLDLPKERQNVEFPLRTTVEAIATFGPDKFMVSAGAAAYEIDVAAGTKTLVRSGLTPHRHWSLWIVGILLLLWGTCWTCAYRRVLLRHDSESKAAERYAWLAVLGTVAVSVLHWGWLLGQSWYPQSLFDPIGGFWALALLWLPAMLIVAVASVFLRGWRRFGATCLVYCVLAMTAQMAFDVWIMFQIIASV